MRNRSSALWLGILALAAGMSAFAVRGGSSGWTLVGWNDLGMHCMDADYGVMAILPPYNTVHAQLIDPAGDLVDLPAGVTVTYEAVADPDGSINATSIGKSNFWDHVDSLFGAALAPDEGLAGFDMPGAANTPQEMVWESEHQWFTAEGVPITPYDDAFDKNYYPMMRLVARDGAGLILASTDVVLPVSDEMDCRGCHASGSGPAAEPAGGWVWDSDAERDYRLNVLRLHDETEAANQVFIDALAALSFDPDGLEATAVGGQSILCAVCHSSNALPGLGVAGVPPLTQSIHGLHAGVTDPDTGMALDDSANRTACYTCHPGSETACLRGAMGAAVGNDGGLAMQCQSCHGGMSLVGSDTREGWFDEPTCQNCHTGTAVLNNGQIRYTDAFSSPGVLREAVDDTFATDPNTPAQGISLYRFSTGHGGLQCSACHGSTHAIFPASHGNDNLQSAAIQGHIGTLVECASCHGTEPNTIDGGPHGMHPVGQVWIDGHKNALDGGGASPGQCQACHGPDDRGTILSQSHADRMLDADDFGTKNAWRGYRIGCYSCHDGPDSEDPSGNDPAAVGNESAEAIAGVEVVIALNAVDPNGDALELRIVSQPRQGVAWIIGSEAHYRSIANYSGADEFTFAAWDGKEDSNLGRVTLNVTGGSLIFSDGFETGDTSGWN